MEFPPKHTIKLGGSIRRLRLLAVQGAVHRLSASRFFQVFVLAAIGTGFGFGGMGLNDALVPIAQASQVDLDSGWLPDITGLPTGLDHFESVVKEVKDAPGDDERGCRDISPNLRAMVFRHFKNYQAMQNAQGIYFDRKVTDHWAHVLAMILKESSGDTASVTDMRGRSKSTYQAKTSLDHWHGMFRHDGRIRYNEQTNYGLTQTSADRLKLSFRLSPLDAKQSDFLQGNKDDIRLNTAIATRRLIWLYQDFAQGRLRQEDKRIKLDVLHEVKNKHLAGESLTSEEQSIFYRHQLALQTSLWHCGTRLMFREGFEGKAGESKLEMAMATVSDCKLGDYVNGYGEKPEDWRCFARWVTLCPALNVDIALLTPLSYFQTRHAEPVCSRTFAKMLTRKP